MSEFDEGKFIVINRKRFNELNSEESIMAGLALIDCISRFRQAYEKDTGKKMDQRYIVCNQDEPYAERVKAIILGTESDHDALKARCDELEGGLVSAIKSIDEGIAHSVKRIRKMLISVLADGGKEEVGR